MRKRIIAAILIWSGLVGVIAAKTDSNPPDVFIGTRQPGFNIPHGFSPEQIDIAIPAIRQNACFQAIGAVRTSLKTRVVFDPCTILESFDITLSDDWQNMTVSGTAYFEEDRKPFTVKLQHYPPAIWWGGFVVLEVDMK